MAGWDRYGRGGAVWRLGCDGVGRCAKGQVYGLWTGSVGLLPCASDRRTVIPGVGVGAEMRGWRLVVLVGLLVVGSSLAACGESASSGAAVVGTVSPTMCTSAPQRTPVVTTVSGPLILGLDDHGGTYTMPPGIAISVSLPASDTYAWTAPKSGAERIVGTVSSRASDDGSASATFVAKGAGTTTLTAEDHPRCEPCPPPAQVWQVTITVT